MASEETIDTHGTQRSSDNEELDNLTLETRTGGAGDIFILGPGKHACILDTIKLEEQESFDKKGMEKRLKFTFKTIKPLGEDGAEEYGEEAVGKHGIISSWPRVTAYDLGENTRASLTILIDQIFGRKLTQDEASRLAISKLVGIQGFVVVGTSQSGKAEFNSFMLPKGKPAPDVAAYLKPVGAALPKAPKPKADEISDLEDPFAD